MSGSLAAAARTSRADQPRDWRHDRADLAGDRAPVAHDRAGVGLAFAHLVGALVGRDRLLAGQAALVDGPDQAWLAAEGLVDGLHRHAGLGGDRGDGGGGIAAVQELSLGGVQDGLAGAAGLGLAAAGVVAAFGLDSGHGFVPYSCIGYSQV